MKVIRLFIDIKLHETLSVIYFPNNFNTMFCVCRGRLAGGRLFYMLLISPEKQDSDGCFSPEERRFVLSQFTGFLHASLFKQGCYGQFLIPLLCEMVTPRYRYTVELFWDTHSLWCFFFFRCYLVILCLYLKKPHISFLTSINWNQMTQDLI